MRGLRAFSLRAACLVVTCCAVWFAIEASRARKQRVSVETVNSAGAVVLYDYVFAEDRDKTKPPVKPGPAWLRELIGDEYFQEVEIVNFLERSSPNDDDVAAVQNFPLLRQLTFWGETSEVTDRTLEFVGSSDQLQLLKLSNSNVHGNGLKHLDELERLDSLLLDGTKIDDAALQHIAEIPNLTWLDLSDTNVSDAGLRHLYELTTLRRLGLTGTKVTKDGAARLKKELPQCDVNWQ